MESKAYFDFIALLRSKGEVAGLWRSIFVGYGGDLSSTRPYQQGDRMRTIHKPSFLRGELMTKEFFGERRLEIRVIVDISSYITPAGNFEPINAKAAKDSVALFADLIQGAADFWDVKVSRDDAPSGFQPQFFRDGTYEQRGSLVFLVSDFYKGPEIYRSFLNQCRSSRIDLIPVFINTSWIWRKLKKRGVSLEGVDVGGGGVGSIMVNKKTLPLIEASLRDNEDILISFFKNQNMPCINLGEADFSGYVREMTRCFNEKNKTRA